MPLARRAEAFRMSNQGRLSRRGWWILFITAVVIVATWPPDGDRSLGLKVTNWLVDPGDQLPLLPAQLGFGLSDDPLAVEQRDAQVRHYDELYGQGGWTRMRLALKVARDPFDPSTTRQVLLLVGVVVGFAVMRQSRV